MKKLIAVLLSIVMLFGLSACGYGASVTADMEESGETAAEEDTSDETAVSENGVMASGILIAYFSKTGNTEEVANRIQELTGGDLFRIETAQPYPEDYTETTQIAQEELENNARPELTGEVENMEDYDTLFIGYPIWWHTAPMAVYTFLESYDLSGKTVIPFCTSGGSDIEESMPAIQELCPDSNILEGLTANNLDDVEPWIESLGVLDDGETETEAASSTDSNILIAYFSLPEDIDTEGIDADAGASVVVDDGEVKENVQYMAEIIQETIGGDLFRIQTEETYPGDHDPLVDQAAADFPGPKKPCWIRQRRNRMNRPVRPCLRISKTWISMTRFFWGTPTGGEICLWPFIPSWKSMIFPERRLSPSVPTEEADFPIPFRQLPSFSQARR